MAIPALYPILASTILTWIRRRTKLPNAQDMTDATIADYLNRFYLLNMPYNFQLFDLKTKYSFETQAGIDRYNVPIDRFNTLQTPCTVDNVPIVMTQYPSELLNTFNLLYFNVQSALATGAITETFTITNAPFLRGHINPMGITDGLSSSVYVTATTSTGEQMVLQDDGSGNLVVSTAPTVPIGTVNYATGAVSCSFPSLLAVGAPIFTQTVPYTAQRPSVALFYDNVITLRGVPDRAYLIEFNAYMTPTQFLETTDSIAFSWMADYLAWGAARLILQDFGDTELISYNEPFFKEQEKLCLRRTIRQKANTSVPTPYNQINNFWGYGYYNNQGGI